MDCQQIDEYILAYCDGTLSPELTVLLDEHLQNCHYCRKMVDLYRMETEILSVAPDIPPLSEDFSLRIMSSLNRSAAPSAPGFRLFSRLGRHRYWLGGTAAAAVLLLALYLPGMVGWNQPLKEVADSPPVSESADTANKQLSQAPNREDANKLMMDQEAPQAEPSPDVDYTVSEPEPAHQAASEEVSIAMRATAYDANETKTQVLKAPENSRNNDALKAGVDPYNPASNTQVEKLADEIDLSTEQLEFDLLSLHPRNIPDEYQIEKIVSTSYNTVSYVYRNPNNQTLEITLALADYRKLETPEYEMRGSGGGSAEAEGNGSEAILTNSTNTSIWYQNHTININLKAAMPLEQLEKLAKSISFEEELSNDTISE